MKSILVSLCVLAAACGAEAQTAPSLSISLLPPAIAQLSWPSNFTAWQLASTTNLNPPANWQPVANPPLPLGNALVVFYSMTDQSRFFRLQQGGSCVFQATPPVISPGGSSVLSWCSVAGTTYTLIPGPGVVTGSSFTVSQAVTTLYTLIASNASGVTPNFASVTVNSGSCGFASVSNWDGTLNFSYELTPSSADYNFIIRQEAHLTFHLTLSLATPLSAEYVGLVDGNAQVNDEVDELSPPPKTATLVGSGAPQPDITISQASRLTLDIDCTTGTYTFTITPNINATYTDFDGNSGASLWAVGGVTVSHRALPVAVGTLSSAEFLPTRGPFWTGGGDFYEAGGLAEGMFTTGTVTDNTAGSASVNWSFVPNP